MTRAKDRSYLPSVGEVDPRLRHELTDEDVLSWLTAHRYFSAAAAMRSERYANLVARSQTRAAQQMAKDSPERWPTLREVFAHHWDYDEAERRGLVY